MDIFPGVGAGGSLYPSSTAPAPAASRSVAGAAGPASAVLPRAGDDMTLARDAWREEAENLRAVLEEKELAWLSTQSEHVKAVAKLRGQVEARDKTIRELKAEALRLRSEATNAENRAMSMQLTYDSRVEQLKEEALMLRLRWEQAQEDARDAMAAASASVPKEQLAALRAEVAALRTERDALARKLSERSAAVASREAEFGDIAATVHEQQANIQALRDQLASFVSRQAADTARAEVAEADAAETRAELDKRLEQLGRVIRALNKVREREASLRTALESQALLLNDVQTQHTELAAAHERAQQSLALVQAQYGSATSRVEELTDALSTAEAKLAAGAAAVAAADATAAAVETLSAALEALKRENGELAASLAASKVELRRETIALQRVADERADTIKSLQADLASATAALSSLSSGTRIIGSSALDAQAHEALGGGGGGGGRSLQRQRGISTGLTAGRVIAGGMRALGMDADAGAHGTQPPEAVLRLQCESLTRRLEAQASRIQHLERQTDELLEVNEQLRAAAASAPATATSSGNGAMSMPAAAQEDASVAPAATSPRTTAARDSTTGAASHTEAELARQVLECEATLVAGVECVQSVASCLAAVTAALEGREPPSEYADASLWISGMGGAGANSLAEGGDHASSAWFLPAHAGRFAGGSALLTELLRSLRAAARANASGEVEGGSVPAEWVNLTFLRRQFEEEAANATSVRADVVERCTNAMGSACAMQ